VLQPFQGQPQRLQRCRCVEVLAAKGFGTIARKGFGLVRKQDFWGWVNLLAVCSGRSVVVHGDQQLALAPLQSSSAGRMSRSWMTVMLA
jgi:hypothetical protein